MNIITLRTESYPVCYYKPGDRKSCMYPGKGFTYLGRNYRLKIVAGIDSDSDAGVKLMNGRFYVQVPPDVTKEIHNQLVVDQLSTWYREHAIVRLRQKTKCFALQMGVSPASVGVKDYKNRWWAVSVDRRIYYNWKVIVATHSIVDYVERKEWLKVNGKGLKIYKMDG